jgi:putative two-component system response regulator
MNDRALAGLKILVVDDQEANLLLLERILGREGYTRVTTTQDPAAVTELFLSERPDLVILDLHMPGMDGFELMDRVGVLNGASQIPFLVVTADLTPEVKHRALSHGALDFLTIPVEPIEVALRVRNMLHVRHLQLELEQHNDELEAHVVERTRDVQSARLELLEKLATVVEYRDHDTREHALRIGRTAAVLAQGLGLSSDEIEAMRWAAALHDIGKVGIPDAILLKPGRLSTAEFEEVKRHTTIGADILSGSKSPILRLGETIALNHHERWDGRGYPAGGTGEDIPLPGRIVAVGDVFDALTHSRPYKPAWPVPDAVREILDQRERQFDPKVVDAFVALDHDSLLEGIDRWDYPDSVRGPASGRVGGRD